MIFKLHDFTCLDSKIAESSDAGTGYAQLDNYALLCAFVRIRGLDAHQTDGSLSCPAGAPSAPPGAVGFSCSDFK
jgi:hypothetical protein